ncbi:MAG: hypothetical protein R3296_14770 [Oleiphilaceae bacterium]|nr:hypothetical protein [Oleiphilaceae bacterium]
MIRQLLDQTLQLPQGQHLEPHARDVGQDWVRSPGTNTYKVVGEAGQTLSVIDAWCVEGACYGYVKYDATGQRYLDRKVFSLSASRAGYSL